MKQGVQLFKIGQNSAKNLFKTLSKRSIQLTVGENVVFFSSNWQLEHNNHVSVQQILLPPNNDHCCGLRKSYPKQAINKQEDNTVFSLAAHTNQQRWCYLLLLFSNHLWGLLAGILTGFATLKYHLYRLWQAEDQICRLWQKVRCIKSPNQSNTQKGIGYRARIELAVTKGSNPRSPNLIFLLYLST